MGNAKMELVKKQAVSGKTVGKYLADLAGGEPKIFGIFPSFFLFLWDASQNHELLDNYGRKFRLYVVKLGLYHNIRKYKQ